MDKAQLIGGVIYYRRDGVPVRLLSNRLYGRREVSGKTVYEIAPPEITAARRDPRSTSPMRVDYGYLILVPQRSVGNSDERLREVAAHELLGPDELPLLKKVPQGFEIQLLVSCASLRGEWHIVKSQLEAEAEMRREAEAIARTRYNDLVNEANKHLGTHPLRPVERESDPVPVTFSLTPAQLRALLDK